MLKIGIHYLNISDFKVLEVEFIYSTGFGSAKTNFGFYVVCYVVFCCKTFPHHCIFASIVWVGNEQKKLLTCFYSRKLQLKKLSR